jgi:hypothetical protein
MFIRLESAPQRLLQPIAQRKQLQSIHPIQLRRLRNPQHDLKRWSGPIGWECESFTGSFLKWMLDSTEVRWVPINHDCGVSQGSHKRVRFAGFAFLLVQAFNGELAYLGQGSFFQNAKLLGTNG